MKELWSKIVEFTKKKSSKPIIIGSAVGLAVVIAVIAYVVHIYTVVPEYPIEEITLPQSTDVNSGVQSETETDENGNVDFSDILTDVEHTRAEKKVDIDMPDDETFLQAVYNLRGNYEEAGYIGQTIAITGVCGTDVYNGVTYHDVYRYALKGDTEADGVEKVGIEYCYDGEYPTDGTWVTVTGVLRGYIENDMTYLVIEALEIEPATEGLLYIGY